MERIPVQWVLDVPPVTRAIALGVVGFATLATTGFLSMSACYYSYDSVFVKGEYYRLFTCLFYTGQFGADSIFHLFMLVRNSQSLEGGFVRSRDYIWLLFIICVSLLIYDSFFINKVLLNHQLSDVINYIWARKNPHAQLSILGLFSFDAIYLPFVHTIIFEQYHKFLSGFIVGHIIFFLIDTYPRLHDGFQPLAPIWDWDKNKLKNNQNEQETHPVVEQIEDQQVHEDIEDIQDIPDEDIEDILDENMNVTTGLNRTIDDQNLLLQRNVQAEDEL